MGNFLLGMLIMWFVYPLLNVTREVIAEKFVLFVMSSSNSNNTTTDLEDEVVETTAVETTAMGFRLSGDK